MRTLKKTLCLVLCLAMMAGLCVFASADFNDQDKIENEEAVAVLTGIGVINGDDKGNFNPEGTLTRAEATVIITKILGAADIKTTTDAFSDVTEGYWGMPYIAYCVGEGIVAGMGDGTFAPNAKLTGYQWATLLLRTIGYKVEGESWQIDVAKLVKSLGLADGITFNGTSEISREDAAQMALNALFVQTVHYEGGSKITAGGVEIVTDSTLVKETYGNNIPETLAHTYFPKLEKKTENLASDDFGRPATVKYELNKKTLYVKTQEPIGVYVNEFTKKTETALKKTYDFDGAVFHYNGGTDANVDTLAELYTTTGGAINGFTIELYADADNNITDVVVYEGFAAVVGKTTAAKKNTNASIALTVYEAGRLASSTGTYPMTIVDDPEVDGDLFDILSAYEEDDVVEVFCAPGWDAHNDGSYILAVAPLTAVEGKVTKLTKAASNTASKITIAGEQYSFNNEAVNISESKILRQSEVLTVGAEGTVYLDENGVVLAYVKKADAKTTYNVAYVNDLYTKTVEVKNDYTGSTTETQYFAQLVTMSGEELNVRVYGANGGNNTASYYTDSKKATTLNKNKLVNYSVAYASDLKDEVASFTAIADTGAAATKAIALAPTANVAKTDSSYAVSGGKVYSSDSQTVLYITGTKAALKVTKVTGKVALDTTALVYATKTDTNGTNYTAQYIVVNSVVPEIKSTDIVYVYGDTESKSTQLVTDKDGEEVTGYTKTVYIDGEETEIVVAAATAITDGFYTYTKNGDLYVLASEGADNLKAATPITNMYNGLITTKDVNDLSVEGATLVDLTGNEDVPTDAAKLATTETVALVLSADLKTVEIIYVVDTTRQ